VAGELPEDIWLERGSASATEQEKKTFPRYCGKTVGSSQVSGLTDAILENHTRYAVAVAGYDKVGNIGPLSVPTCGEPIPVDDFWDLYTASEAGPNMCQCSLEQSAGLPISAGFAGGMLAAITLVLRRSRRTRQTKALARERA
jgi:hypothetical protein